MTRRNRYCGNKRSVGRRQYENRCWDNNWNTVTKHVRNIKNGITIFSKYSFNHTKQIFSQYWKPYFSNEVKSRLMRLPTIYYHYGSPNTPLMSFFCSLTNTGYPCWIGLGPRADLVLLHYGSPNIPSMSFSRSQTNTGFPCWIGLRPRVNLVLLQHWLCLGFPLIFTEFPTSGQYWGNIVLLPGIYTYKNNW
jgi:hypothetical protein